MGGLWGGRREAVRGCKGLELERSESHLPQHPQACLIGQLTMDLGDREVIIHPFLPVGLGLGLGLGALSY